MTDRLVSVGDDFKLPAAVRGALLPADIGAVALGRAVPGRRLAALGDSVTAGIIGAATPNANNLVQGSYLAYGCMASLGRLEWGGQFGVPGNTSAQILARVGDVIAAKPDMCIVLGGTNDSVFTGPHDNLPLIYTALRAAGIEPVVATLPPSSSTNAITAGPHTFIRKVNAWLAEYAAAHGLRLIDFFGALVDPATGLYKTGYNSDITHPNQTGYRAMGQVVANVLPSQVKAGTSWLTQDIGESTILSKGDGGLFTTGTTLPASWSQSAGAAGAFVTDAFFLGRAYQIARAGGDSTVRVVSFTIAAADWNFQPGDLVSLSCKVKTVGLEASGGIATVSIDNNGSSGATNVVSWQIGANFPDGGVVYYEAVVPAGTTSLTMSIRLAGGTGPDTFTVGQYGARNLTRMASYP